MWKCGNMHINVENVINNVPVLIRLYDYHEREAEKEK